MLGMIYLIFSGILGYEILTGLLSPPKKEQAVQGINQIWFLIPASFGLGTLMLTWTVYVASWLASVCAGAQNPLLYGNLAGFLVSIAATYLYLRAGRKGNTANTYRITQMVTNRKSLKNEAVYFGILFVCVSYMMFYVFNIHGGRIYSGFTVYGDYAPHTAMMRSFSLGNNFPTQYPHFGGADVKYHFMFQFLSGNLEYLGLPLDWAYNVPSILSLVGFLMLLYLLAVRITGKTACGILTGIFFFFRSGAAFFVFVLEHMKAGNLAEAFAKNTSFIGYTLNENWGLWNFNVYLNQRHLAFGLLVVSVAVWIYMDALEAGLDHKEKGLVWLKDRLLGRSAWKSRNPETALVLGMVLGLLAFWNGAALIGGLLILMGFGIFSDGKLDYAVTAAAAVFFSVLQSRIFISGQAMSPKIQFGFLAEEKSLWGVIIYLFFMSGVFFLGLAALACFLKRKGRVILLSFLFPTVFAFVFSLTPDINVNHKYIMISYAFLAMFWADAVCRLSGKGITGKITAVLLSLCLTVTGIYDFAIILRGNGPGRRVSVKAESGVTDWLSENLGKNDLLLTPQYSMNEVTMSGVMMYCGWPYYAWSAGYDTNYRAAQAVTVYTTADRQELKETVEKERITYILFEEGMEFEQRECREDVIRSVYPEVFESEDRRIRIYETTDKESNTGNTADSSASGSVGISAEK